jgi:hypothetical protein
MDPKDEELIALATGRRIPSAVDDRLTVLPKAPEWARHRVGDGTVSPHPLSVKAAGPTIDERKPEDREAALDAQLASRALGERIVNLCRQDIEADAPLKPVSFTTKFQKIIGVETAIELGLRREILVPIGGGFGETRRNIDLAQPIVWLRTILRQHPDPARVFAEALPVRSERFFVLHMALRDSVKTSRRPGRTTHFEGEETLSRWHSLPEAARAAFPEPVDRNFTALAKLSPRGEMTIGLPNVGVSDVLQNLAHAMMLDGALTAFLAEETKTRRKK